MEVEPPLIRKVARADARPHFCSLSAEQETRSIMFRRLMMISLIAAVAACSSHSTSTSSSGASGKTGSNAAAPVGEQSSTYATEQAAQAHCPTDEVVWMNTSSHAYHTKGTTYYGHTKHGGYGCRKEADASGYHEAGKHAAPG